MDCMDIPDKVKWKQEVPEFFRTSDAMKQTVEIVEDEEILQTTTCTPKDIDKDPKGWKVAFQDELDSFERLDVMGPLPLNTLDTSALDILPCKVVMVKKPQGDGTHRKKGRVCCVWKFPTGTTWGGDLCKYSILSHVTHLDLLSRIVSMGCGVLGRFNRILICTPH